MSQQVNLYVTFIEKEGPYVKVWGQLDRNLPIWVDKALQQMAPQFDQGHFLPALDEMRVGKLLCCKYHDANYYRARILNTNFIQQGVIEVQFVDYGNREMVQCIDTRTLSNLSASLISICPQAKEFILANVTHTGLAWEEPFFELISKELRYLEFQMIPIVQAGAHLIVRLYRKGEDVSVSLINRGLVASVPLEAQQLVLQNPMNFATMRSPPGFMPVQTPPRGIQYPTFSPQPIPHPFGQPTQMSPIYSPQSPGLPSQPTLLAFKSIPLEPGTELACYVSYVSDGPCLFSVQPEKLESTLKKLMTEIQKIPLQPLEEHPLPGTVCLARSLDDNLVCRAVVTNMVDSRFKVFYVDFGNTEEITFDKMYQIPFKYIIPKVMACRFALAGIERSVVTVEMKCAFKNFVNNRLLYMRVQPSPSPSSLALCDLWDQDKKNALDVIKEVAAESYPEPVSLSRGTHDIKVSFVYSCNRFYVQLKSKEEDLNQMMVTLQTKSKQLSQFTNEMLIEGLPCLALYEADGQWYRAQVIRGMPDGVLVRYVDYGNEEVVQLVNIRKLQVDEVIGLRPQAIECSLHGYQNMPPDQERDNLLEALILENEYSMKIIEVQESRAIVDLIDENRYNVNSLLLEKIAAATSQVSPLLVQDDHRIEHRKKASPPHNDERRSRQKETNENNWRQNKNQSRDSNENDWEGKEQDSWRQSKPKSFNEREGKPEFKSKRSENHTAENTTTERHFKGRGDRKFDKLNDSSSDANSDFGDKPRKYEDRGGYKFGTDRSGKGNLYNTDESRGDRFEKRGGDRDGFKNYRNNDGGDRFKGGRYDGESFVRAESENWGDGGSNDRFGGGGSDRGRGGRSDRGGRFEDRGRRFGDRDRQGFDRNQKHPHGSGEGSKRGKPRHRREDNFDRSSRPSRGDKPFQRKERREDTFQEAPANKESWDDGSISTPVTTPAAPTINPAPADAQFVVEDLAGLTEKILISWFQNPGRFFCQRQQTQNDLKTLMEDIQKTYKNIPTTSSVVGAPVIAQFPQDRVLYRAVVWEVKVNQYVVEYVDFGNKSAVDKIWPIDSRFMILPRQSFLCGLQGIKPEGDKWQPSSKYASYFNKESFNAVFIGVDPEDQTKYLVDLWNNEENMTQQLITSGLGVVNVVAPAPTKLDMSLLPGQQLRVTLGGVVSLSEFSIEVEPGLAVACSMHNLATATETDEETLRKWIGYPLIVYVDDLVEGKLEVTLYDNAGYKLEIVKPDEGAYDSIDPLCGVPVLESNLHGYIPHASSASIFVQPMKYALFVDQLLNRLSETYEPAEVQDPIIPDIEGVYAVKSSDTNWYRGKVMELNEKNVTVMYIDYGNTETVTIEDLRILSPEFFELHTLAIEVFVPKPSEDLIDQEVQLRIFLGDLGWHGEFVTDESAPVENLLVSEQVQQAPAQEVIVPQVQPVDPQKTELSEATPVESPPQIGISVILSHMDTPGEFYLQSADALDEIDNLQSVLQEQIESLDMLDNPTAGILCAAKYSVDQVWYRAQVLDADAEITTVRFIDYGNTDVLENKESCVKTLPADLLSLAQHARRCSLNYGPTEEEWNQAAIQRFEALTAEAELFAEITHQDEKTTYVELYASGTNIGEVLLTEGLAVRCQEQPEQQSTGFVSHLNSPSEFWIQLENSVADLEWVAEQLTSAENYPELEDLTPGSLCAAIFAEDEMWYRARILSNTVAGLEVLFIDYGNSYTCTTVRELPEDLIMLPPLAQKCSLQKPPGILQWSQKAIEKFKEISADGATVFTVNRHTPGETSIVQLFLDGADVSDQMLPETVEGFISYLESVDNFWIQKSTMTATLDEITVEIANVEDWPQKDDAEVGDLVACLFEDELWYRARVISKSEAGYEVEFVDYGNRTVTEKVHFLNEELQSQPCCALQCTLEPLPGFNFSETSNDKFLALNYDGTTLYQIEFVTDSSVRLYVNYADVRSSLDMVKSTPIPSLQSSPIKSVEKTDSAKEEPNLEQFVMGELKQIVDDILQVECGAATLLSEEISKEVVEEMVANAVDLSVASINSSAVVSSEVEVHLEKHEKSTKKVPEFSSVHSEITGLPDTLQEENSASTSPGMNYCDNNGTMNISDDVADAVDVVEVYSKEQEVLSQNQNVGKSKSKDVLGNESSEELKYESKVERNVTSDKISEKQEVSNLLNEVVRGIEDAHITQTKVTENEVTEILKDGEETNIRKLREKLEEGKTKEKADVEKPEEENDKEMPDEEKYNSDKAGVSNESVSGKEKAAGHVQEILSDLTDRVTKPNIKDDGNEGQEVKAVIDKKEEEGRGDESTAVYH